MDDVALYVVGPRKWYKNLENAFCRHQIPETFVQYNKSITPFHKTKWGCIEFGELIDSQINKDGYIKVYGHVSKTWPEGSSCVEYILVVDRYQTGTRTFAPLGKLNPNKNVAPYFDDYDKIIGKCENDKDFKYETWLHATHIQKVNPVDYSKFIRYDSIEPVGKSDLRKVGIFLVYCFDEMEPEPENDSSLPVKYIKTSEDKGY